jgi:hypothetical protein
MNDLSRGFELLLGHATFKLWADLPREMQEKLFEAAVPGNPLLRYSFAVFLHDHHPRTARPPKAGVLARTLFTRTFDPGTQMPRFTR